MQYITASAEAVEALMDGLPTNWLVGAAISGYEHITGGHSTPVYVVISGSSDEAAAYLTGQDDEYARWDAASALVMNGWTRSDVCRTRA